ncbi:MAG: hypothetical protein KDC54_09655 [Lewinella sp.]|nr:hypothetical protein [Lewinella sp.]
MFNMPARIIHILVAILVFISSTGLMMSRHYCQRVLKDTAVFAHARSCHEDATVSCPLHGSMPIPDHDDDDDGCCDEKTSYYKVDQEQAMPLTTLFLPSPAAGLITPVFAGIPVLEAASAPAYLHYKPPPLVCELHLRFQTFRC